MSPRPDVSTERITQILDAAEQVFTRKGFDEARMDDIVDETDLSKGTLYWYFKSKNDLIIAILDRIFQREFQKMESASFAKLSATQSLWMITDMIVADITRMQRLMPIAYEFLALAFRNQQVQGAIQHYFNRYMELLIPIIQRGIESEEFRNVDAQEVAIAAGAIFEGTILLWVYDKNCIDPQHHIRSGIRLLLEGIQISR